MSELGEFLRSRRASLRPEEAGLHTYGTRRRVPGMRREELAQLAGVSVAYYTRLEQGQSRNASDAVLDALARALNLDGDEEAHLQALARPARAKAARPRSRPERVRPAVRALLASLGDVPALHIGRRTDVLGWTPMGRALLYGHLPYEAPEDPASRPNMIKLLFTDPHVRDLYSDRKTKTRDAAAHLRMATGRYPDDPKLTELIGELSVASNEFAALWAGQHVYNCKSTVRELRHPLVGTLTVAEEPLDLLADEGQRLVIYSAEPGSPSDASLRILASTL